MKETKFIIKFIILPVFLIVVFNFLEYDFKWDQFYKFVYPMILTIIFVINMQVSKLRRFSFALAYGMLILMIILYLANQLELSNIIGSAGFTILIITLLNYLPGLIKKGYLEKY